MKAPLLKNTGNLTLSEIATPRCGPNEILIKIEACSICAADLKIVECGHRDLVLPRVPGHEIAGTIVQAGANVKGYLIGQRVHIAPGIYCGECKYCRADADNMCEQMKILGFHLDGGYAEYMLVPQRGVDGGVISIIPEQLSFEQACLAEPLACCINAVTLGKVAKEDTVVIFGAGPVGCLLIQLCRFMETSNIIVVEKDKGRLSFAGKFNADCYIHDNGKDVFKLIKQKAGDKGVDVLLSACSDETIPAKSIDILAKRGRIVFFSGITKENISVNYNNIHYKELSIAGAYGCSFRQNKKALELIAKKVIEVKSLITHRFSLDEMNRAMETAKDKKAMKVIITNQEV